MNPSPQTFSSLDELRQIQTQSRQSVSFDELRSLFERLQVLRRAHIDDFDLQLFIAEVHDEIVERARALREDSKPIRSVPANSTHPPDRHLVRKTERTEPETPEVPPDVQRIDAKTWQRATYLALFFATILFAAFFYLVQTARRINMTPAEVANQQQAKPAKPVAKTATTNQTPSTTPIPAPSTPTVRLYTDLVPGSISLDGGAPRDLTDGELVLDDLQPGRHSLKVTGGGGSAAFSFDVAQNAAPRVVGLPTVSNAMTVLVSAEDGQGKLISNAGNAEVLLDGKPAGTVGDDGLALAQLGKTDHDLQIAQGKDRQRFVLTYTPTPALTVYVKSDPNAGTAVVVAGQEGVEVYINDKLYRRQTDRGQVRIPLKVGDYVVRVHKAGFIDPPPRSITVKKAEETAVNFRLDPVPQVATLEIRGALPGTMVYLDKDFATLIGPDGNANVANVKPGDHAVELLRDQAVAKQFQRTFRSGDVVLLTGPDVTLEKAVVAETKPTPPPPVEAAPKTSTQEANVDLGGQVRRGGGFVPYHVPKTPGRYTFTAHGPVGGFLKHNKLQWYAGFQDSKDYVLFTLDGKHAVIHNVHDGKSTEVAKIPFNVNSNESVQVDLSVKADSVSARIKTPGGVWSDLGAVSSPGRDFTQDKVGFYIPENDEVAVSDFRFSNR